MRHRMLLEVETNQSEETIRVMVTTALEQFLQRKQVLNSNIVISGVVVSPMGGANVQS